MPKYIVDLWLDGYDSEEETEEECKKFIYEQLNMTASSVSIEKYNDDNDANLIFGTKSEREVINFLKAQENNQKPMFFIDNFTCKFCNDEGDWTVAFRIRTKNHKTLDYGQPKNYQLRSKSGDIRRFLRLNGALKFMQKVGVDEFTGLIK